MRKSPGWSGLLLVLILVCMAPAVVAAYTIDLEYGWSSDEMESKRVDAFHFLGVSGSRYPETSMGSNRELRLLPAGHQMMGYEIVSEKWESVQGSFRPGRISLDGLVDLESDSPGGLISIESGSIMGYSVLVTEVQPVRLNSGGTSILEELKVRVDIGPGAGMRPFRRSRHMDMHVRQMLEGYLGEDLDGYGDWQVETIGDWISEGPSKDGSAVDCVIITADSLRTEFDRLAEWHDRLGARTVVRTMEWVRQRYPGMDAAEKVRNFIKDAYQNWGTVYIVLGGDTRIVPIRTVDVPKMKENIGRTEMPTDIYYANLDGNWNANGNSLIGEYDIYVDDGIDFYSDVMIGRALVASLAEARIFVDKTLHYSSGSNRGVWQRTVLSLAQQLFTHLDGAYWSELILENFPVTWSSTRLYQNYQDYPGSLEESVVNALAYMDSGANIISHIGHGDELRLDLGTEFMERFQLDGLSNDTSYSFIYMMNCSSSDPRVESVGKTFTRNPDGGAFAVIGNSSLAFPGTGLPMEDDFFELIFSEGRPTIGAASAFYRQPFSPTDPLTPTRFWMYLNYLLIGDPIVNLWLDEARTAEIIASSQMVLADTVYSVEVRHEGMPAAGAVVTLLGDRDEYGVGVTGVDGMAHVRYRPRGPGWVDVVVSGAGFAVSEDSVQVTDSGGHLYVSGIDIDDGSGWTGNDDGMAGWGERVGLGVSLVNGGLGTLDGVTADLRVIPGCSLTVSVEMDSLRSADDVFVGSNCEHPDAIPFPLVAGEGTLGRCGREQQDLFGCWIWLDAMGWHVRFMGDGESHTYECTLRVHTEMVGHSGHALESGDIITSGGGEIVLAGSLAAGDFEDGLDLVLGMDGSVVVHEGQADYGTVGSSDVTGWYDVEYLSGGVGDGLGVWYELSIFEAGIGNWSDWFRVEVLDGDLVGERIDFESLGGDTTGVIYGLRNSGGGALSGVEGRLRGLSGVEVTDSVSVYGELCSGCYSEGDYYRVRELGGPVSYEVYLEDAYGRVWRDTIDVRTVEPSSGLVWTVTEGDIALGWVSSSDTEVVGYDIYRSGSYGGPFELAGMADGVALYTDSGLSSEEDYYYYVCARDSMGNLSAPSETAEVWTGAATMPGWPVELRGAAFPSAVVGDADHDGNKEVFIGSKGLEVTGFDSGGRQLPGFPYQGTCEVWASPALADLDGDGTLECIVSESMNNTEGVPHCTTLLAFNHDGSFVAPENNPLLPADSPGWPYSMVKRARSSPTVCDLDQDGKLEVIIGEEVSPGTVYIFRYDGSAYIGDSQAFTTISAGLWATPCVYDLDDDGTMEIVICGKDGGLYIWNHDGTEYIPGTGGLAYASGVLIMSSPVIGDIDGDQWPEIVAVNTFGQVLAWNHDATPVNVSTPVIAEFGEFTQATPALADFDGDDDLEIVAGFGTGDGKLVLIDGDGSAYGDDEVILTWNYALGYSSPVVADVDADGQLEIITCTENGYVVGVESDGAPAPGFPRKIDGFIYSSPLIEDLDDDGDMDLFVPGYDSRLHAWDLGSPYSAETVPWPMQSHDRWHTGGFGFVAPGDTTAPSYSIAVFQSSVLERAMDIHIAPGENLQDIPNLEIRSGGVDPQPLSVEAVNGTDRLYRGHYVTEAAAAETIHVSGTDTYGNVGTQTRVITYSTLIGEAVVVRSADGLLLAEAGDLQGSRVLAMLPVDADYIGGMGAGDDAVIRPAAYNLCVVDGPSTGLKLEAVVEAGSDDALYRFDGPRGWVQAEGQTKSGGRIVLEDAEPGIYGLGKAASVAIEGLRISRAKPNPFNLSCSIVVSAPPGLSTRVSVFDVRGRRVATIFSGRVEGAAPLSWDGRDTNGSAVSSGIYFLRAEAGSMVASEKVILVR